MIDTDDYSKKWMEWLGATFPRKQGVQIFWEFLPSKDKMEITVYFHENGVKHRGRTEMFVLDTNLIAAINQAIEEAEVA